MKKFPVLFLLLAGVCAFAATLRPAAAQTERPELVENTKTVYKRVLATGDANLLEAPGGATVVAVRAFQPLYVYEGVSDGFLRVGRSLASGAEGWIATPLTVPWRSNMIASFATPAGRERQLMFESRAALQEAIAGSESAMSELREMRLAAIGRQAALESAGTGAPPAPASANGVVSIEPRDHVDLNENFYIMPILEFREDNHPMSWDPMLELKIASLPLKAPDGATDDVPPPTVGMVFVFDTTSSMRPYIDATRNAVYGVVDRIANSEAGALTRFGAVGFRDSVEAALARDAQRNIEYRRRVFLNLAEGAGAAVRAGFDQIEEAESSTVDFHEDSVSGVLAALNDPGWTTAGRDGGPIDLKYVVLISDASPKPPEDASLPEELRGLLPEDIRARAKGLGITLITVHVKTLDGRANHTPAERAYRAMATQPPSGASSFYEEVDLTGNAPVASAFGPVVERISSQVVQAHSRTLADLQARAQAGQLSAIEEDELAQRLAYLGRVRDADAEAFFEAWTIDRSLERPEIPALDLSILVSRNELSTMAQVLNDIIQLSGSGGPGGTEQSNFFTALRGSLAQFAQNPDLLAANVEFESLEEAIGEALSELPYREGVLDLTEPEWLNSASRQGEVIDRVRSRFRIFQQIYGDDRLWIQLYEGQPEGEWVYPLPIGLLP